MRSYWRIAVVTLFVLAFTVTVPAVIMTTAGYRYNLLRGRIEKTGIIQARSNPRGATVWINDVAQATKTPLEMRRVLAEDYHVKLTMDGYLPWEKTLSVYSGQTAFTGVVNLLRDSLPKLAYEGRFSRTVWSPDGGRFAFLRAGSDELQELGVWNAAGAPSTLARLKAEVKDLTVAWSPDGKRLLLTNATGKNLAATVYVPGTSRLPLTLGQDKLSGVTDARWSFDGSVIIAKASNGLFRVSPETGTVSPIAIGRGMIDATVRDNETFVIRRNEDGATSLYSYADQLAPVPLASLPSELVRFRGWQGNNLLISDDRRGRLLTYDRKGRLLNEANGVQTAAAPDGRLLSWNDFELYVTEADGSKTSLITRLSSPLRSCVWYPESSHVICATDDKIFAVEMDGRDRRNTWDLVRISNCSDLNVTSLGPQLRFTGTIGNQSGLFVRDL